MPHRRLPVRRGSITNGAGLAQLATASSPDPTAAQIFPVDRNKFKESARPNSDGASTSSDSGPKRSHWEQRGVALVQVIAQPDHLGNLQQELLAEGYEVSRAASIREASDVTSTVNYYPDVVLLDGGLAGPQDRNLQNLKMFFSRSKTMVLGRCTEAGEPCGISCISAFRQGVSDFMWYPSVGGLEELTARIERLLNECHKAELEANRQKAANEKEEMMGRMMRLKEMQRLDAESQKASSKPSDQPQHSSLDLAVSPDKRATLASMVEEEGDEEDELFKA